MFEYIRGVLQYKGTDYCVVDVNGVGFKIFTSHITASGIGQAGETVTLFTYMNVKEDDISLFGFASREELSVFNMLISVSGVGPKMGIAVLAAMSPSEFSLAVATGDYKAISKSKGIGPKLAQRIVLELKDKINKDIKSQEQAPEETFEPVPTGYISNDAISALMVLGYSSKEASKLVAKVYKDGMTLEETVRQALKQAF
jgi:Holliday junction DNA helicase RuvA